MLKLSGAGRCGGEFGGAWSTAGSGFVVVRVLLVVALAASVLQFAHGPAAAQADTEAPTLVSATIAHGRLVLTYDEALDTSQSPHWAGFTIKVTAPEARARTIISNGATSGGITVTGTIVVSGETVTAALTVRHVEGQENDGVVAGETVVVSYDPSAAGRGGKLSIRDTAGNLAAALTDRAVENLTDPSPVVVSARVLRDSLSITFDRPLSTADDAVPDGGQFTVGLLRDGAMRQIRAPQGEGWVSVDGSAVSVRLSDGVRPGDTGVTVSYSHSSGSTTLTGTLRGAGDAGGLVAPFSDRAVVNAATAAPAPTGAVFVDDSLLLTFDAPLDPGAVPDPSQFVVTYDEFGATRSYDVAEGGVAVSGPTVTLTLTSNTSDRFPLLELDYMRTTPDDAEVFTALRGVGDGGEVLPFTDLAVTLSRPRLAATGGAVVEGSTLTLTFDTALDDGADHVPDKSQFTVTVTPAGGTAQVNTVTAVAVSGQTVTLTLTNSVAAGSSVLVSYAQDSPSADLTKKLRGATAPYPLVAAFTELDLAKPGLSATGGAMVDGSTLTLTFDKALDDGAAHVPDKSQFTVAVTPAGATPQVNAVTAVAVSGQTVTLTLTAPVAADSSVRVSYAQDSPSSDLTKKLRGATAPNPLVTAFSNRAVTNATPPAPVSASVTGATLTMVFDTALDDGADHVPDKSQFTVAVTPAGGTAQTNAVTAVAVSGQTVTLTLTNSVAADSTATVSYTQDSPSADLTKKLRGATAPNPLAAAFSEVSVTVEQADTIAPTLAATDGAVIVRDTLTLTYNEPLDESSTPGIGVFVVTVPNDAPAPAPALLSLSPDTVSVEGSQVVLTLDEFGAIAKMGDTTVTVAYTPDSGSVQLQDLSGNTAGPLSAHSVRNDTTAAPMWESASVNAGELEVVFNARLDPNKVPGTDQFTVSSKDASQATRVFVVSDVSISDTKLILMLSNEVRSGDIVTWTYAFDVGSLRTRAALRGDGHSGRVAGFSVPEVTNNTPAPPPPVLAHASVDGDKLVLIFDVLLNVSAVPTWPQFTVAMTKPSASTATMVHPVAADGGVEIVLNIVKLKLSRPVGHGDSVTVKYSQTDMSGSSTPVLLRGATGGAAVAAFSGESVVNGTPLAPVSASVAGTTLTMEFSAALDANSVPDKSQFTVTVTPTSGAVQDNIVTDVAVSGSKVTLTLTAEVAAGATVTVSYSKTADQSATAVLLRAAAAPKAEAAAFDEFSDAPPVLASSDAALRALTLSGVTLSPVFAAANVVYVASVANDVSSITVAAAQNHADAEVVITPTTDADASADGHQVNLDVGSNTITVKVTAEDDTTTRTYTVTVTRAAPAPPKPLSASVNGDTLVMVFDADLDASATLLPTRPQFTVAVTKPDNTATTVRPVTGAGGIAVAGKTVTLKLGSPVAHGDTVTVAYSQTDTLLGSTARLLTGANGAAVADFRGQAVTNDTPAAGAAPALSSASVNGDKLELVFDADLDEEMANLPMWPQFAAAVTKPGASTATTVRPVAAAGGVAVVGRTVTLKLRSPVDHGDSVTVSYSQTDMSESSTPVLLRGANGVAVAGFTDWAVDNITQRSPVPESGSGSVNGDTLVLVFDADLDEAMANLPMWPQFAAAVTKPGASTATTVYPVAAAGGVAVVGRTVTLKLRSPVDRGDTVTVSYSQTYTLSGSTAVLLRGATQGMATPGVAVAEFTGQAVTNVTGAAASDDAGLSALSLSSGTLSPVFAATTYDYTASVANSVSSTTVTATPNAADATVVITPMVDADAGTDGHQVNLNVGDTTITVTVTAQDSTTTETYTVTVTRATVTPPAPQPPSRGGGGGGGGGGAAAPPPAAQRDEVVFDDVDESDAHFAAVRALAGGGVLAGTLCEPLRFCGGEALPRWMMAVWLVRVLDGRDPAPVASSRFADVDPGLWWARHAERLAELGVTRGCSQAPVRFCPQDPVTRAQMASFLRRAFKLAAAAPAGFADTADSVHAASIDALSAAGITRGCATGPLRYCPRDPVTRAQMASLLVRAGPGRARRVAFDDINASDAHFAAVRALAADGVLAGTLCEPLRFCGGEALPRWMMAVWLVRVVDGRDPAPVASSRFADVDPGLWWARHAERLAELGVTRGCSQAPVRFCPQDPVTRAQMASFLRRAFKLAAAAAAGFADTADSVHAASIDALSAAGITRGCATGPLRYCPRDPVTRAQMASLLVRARAR